MVLYNSSQNCLNVVYTYFIYQAIFFNHSHLKPTRLSVELVHLANLWVIVKFGSFAGSFGIVTQKKVFNGKK